MKRKYLLLHIICIVFCIVMNACKEEPVSATLPERNFELALADFNEIHYYMSYEDVISLVGECHYRTGNGLIYSVYDLLDGSSISFFYGGGNVIDMYLSDQIGRHFSMADSTVPGIEEISVFPQNTEQKYELTLADFNEVFLDMSRENVISLVGEEHYTIGEEIIGHVYELQDGSRIILYYDNDSLVDMAVVDQVGRYFWNTLGRSFKRYWGLSCGNHTD